MARDEELGKVDSIVIAPGTGEVVALVVRKGLVFKRDTVIPIEAVEDASEDVVRVSLDRSEQESLQEFRSEDFIAPPDDWTPPPGPESRQNVLFHRPGPMDRRDLQPVRVGQTPGASGGRPIRAGMTVVARDGEVGKVDLVLVDPISRRATYFVIRRDGLLGHDTIVPVDWAVEIDPDRIVLDVPKAKLAELPLYRPDEEILADVLDALWSDHDLKPAELAFVEVRVRDGVVELSGHTLTERSRDRIKEIVRHVPSVMGVRDNLETFEALARGVQERRTFDPATRSPLR
jgi:uncharacterized protein YrrD